MSNAGPSGWTDSLLELLKIQVLDHLAQDTKERIRVEDLASSPTNDPELLDTALRALVSDGLLNKMDRSLGDRGVGPVRINGQGSALIQQRRERRSNRKLRAVACRDALLDWCYEEDHPNIDDFDINVRSFFEGDPFTPEEFHSASRDLKDKGLISGTGAMGAGIIRPQITAIGKTVVETYNSSISDWENRSATPKPSNTFNFQGSTFSGQMSVGDSNQMNQTTGISTSELAQLVQAVLGAAEGTEQQPKVNNLIAQLQLEAAEEEPDSAIVSKTLDRLETVATQSASGALVEATRQLIDFTLRWAGLK